MWFKEDGESGVIESSPESNSGLSASTGSSSGNSLMELMSGPCGAGLGRGVLALGEWSKLSLSGEMFGASELKVTVDTSKSGSGEDFRQSLRVSGGACSLSNE